MADLQGQTGELRFTIKVTRKETGAVEEYDLIGTVIQEKDTDDGGDTQHSCAQRGD